MNDLDLPVSFGEWIKSRRKALDLTQEELAQRSGCSIFALRKIETGERRPSKQLAGLLAAALDIPQEDRATFIRVARGETSLERIRSYTHLPQATSPPPQPVVHHLPISPTPLLGREFELAAMERIFNDPECRLLTLTGVGGVGKTRLGIEFAARQCGKFPDGVHYVALASINSAELIVPAIAEALEFSFSGPTDPKEQLFHHMAREVTQAALLVLDNFEHLLVQSSAAVNLVAEFLQRFANLKILCTSRERLNLHGEWIYELHGLSIPPSNYVDNLKDYNAAALFMQCARRINASFEMAEEDRSALVRVCQMLEGIPLAIELAAAWVGVLSCNDIAQEIEANIDFLTTSMRDIPERHRSLRATFDHSWRLLTGAERATLSRLAVFHGGFDRAAAEQIAGATLMLLSSLASKSLVRRTQDGRYDLHEVIRQYALAHLNEDRVQFLETCDRHSEYYLHLACGYERKLKSGAQQAAMREMTLEFDNMRTAWVWGIKNEKFESITRAVRAFGWYFEVAGLIYDGIEQLDLLVQALRKKPHEIPVDKALGATLVQQGLLCFRSGQFPRAQDLYHKAIEILRTVDAPGLLADALIFSGTLAHLNGSYLEAKASITEGLVYAQEANDPWFTAYGIYNLGHVDSLIGDTHKGYAQMKEGLALWRSIGDPHSISLGLNFFVETQLSLGRSEEAIASMQESIALCERTKNRWGMGTAYRYLGLAKLATGRIIEAQADLQKSLEIFGEYFVGWDIARTLTYLGDAVLAAGDLCEAEKKYLEALRLAVESKSVSLALDALVGLARVHLCRGEAKKAARLATFIQDQAASTQETKNISRQIILQTEKQVGVIQDQGWDDPTAVQSLDEIVNIYLRPGGDQVAVTQPNPGQP